MADYVYYLKHKLQYLREMLREERIAEIQIQYQVGSIIWQNIRKENDLTVCDDFFEFTRGDTVISVPFSTIKQLSHTKAK